MSTFFQSQEHEWEELGGGIKRKIVGYTDSLWSWGKWSKADPQKRRCIYCPKAFCTWGNGIRRQQHFIRHVFSCTGRFPKDPPHSIIILWCDQATKARYFLCLMAWYKTYSQSGLICLTLIESNSINWATCGRISFTHQSL